MIVRTETINSTPRSSQVVWWCLSAPLLPDSWNFYWNVVRLRPIKSQLVAQIETFTQWFFRYSSSIYNIYKTHPIQQLQFMGHKTIDDNRTWRTTPGMSTCTLPFSSWFQADFLWGCLTSPECNILWHTATISWLTASSTVTVSSMHVEPLSSDCSSGVFPPMGITRKEIPHRFKRLIKDEILCVSLCLQTAVASPALELVVMPGQIGETLPP